MDLDMAFRESHRVLRPGGVLISRFGPLFLSPHGYHLYWVCQVPYAHLLFGLRALVALRNARPGTNLQASTWKDLGLNTKRFDDFRRIALAAGLEVLRFAALPVRGQRWLTRVPLIRDFFISGVDCHLRKPIGSRVQPCSAGRPR